METYEEIIEKEIKNNKAVLFMKGNPAMPQCGFSMKVSQVLTFLMGEGSYATVDVLSDEHIREGIKTYSDWPTIPQLYVDKEFVGGCDIVTSMHQDGELATLFQEVGVVVAD